MSKNVIPSSINTMQLLINQQLENWRKEVENSRKYNERFLATSIKQYELLYEKKLREISEYYEQMKTNQDKMIMEIKNELVNIKSDFEEAKKRLEENEKNLSNYQEKLYNSVKAFKDIIYNKMAEIEEQLIIYFPNSATSVCAKDSPRSYFIQYGDKVDTVKVETDFVGTHLIRQEDGYDVIPIADYLDSFFNIQINGVKLFTKDVDIAILGRGKGYGLELPYPILIPANATIQFLGGSKIPNTRIGIQGYDVDISKISKNSRLFVREPKFLVLKVFSNTIGTETDPSASPEGKNFVISKFYTAMRYADGLNFVYSSDYSNDINANVTLHEKKFLQKSARLSLLGGNREKQWDFPEKPLFMLNTDSIIFNVENSTNNSYYVWAIFCGYVEKQTVQLQV